MPDAHQLAHDLMVDFTVTGTGPFPTDMLRFDECWPIDIASAACFAADATADRMTVRLRCLQTRGETRPTIKRWESFGWKVEGHVIDDEPPASALDDGRDFTPPYEP